MTFAYPWVLLLLIVLIPLAWWIRRRQNQTALGFSHLRLPGKQKWKASSSFTSVAYGLPQSLLPDLFLILRISCLALLCIAMARPQTISTESKRNAEVFDMVLTIDTSESMAALDFEINGKRRTRLDVVKTVLDKFIDDRAGDRLGLVVFGEEAFTQAPLTMDKDILRKLVEQMHLGMAGRATAIGNAIAVASKRLEAEETKSKIIILLTDGANTAGEVDPRAAAAAAKTLGIKIYTIAIGSTGRVPFATQGFFGQQMQYMEVPIDFELLQEIADTTGGKAFRASNTNALREIYESINKLEKTKVEIEEYNNYTEHFQAWALPALVVLLVEFLLQLTPWRRIP